MSSEHGGFGERRARLERDSDERVSKVMQTDRLDAVTIQTRSRIYAAEV